jgi:hypothetical protein
VSKNKNSLLSFTWIFLLLFMFDVRGVCVCGMCPLCGALFIDNRDNVFSILGELWRVSHGIASCMFVAVEHMG